MTKADSYQVAGGHYRGTDYQHWSWVTDVQLDYLLGCATKYVVRWRKKDGVVGLQKSLHFLNKFEEEWHSDNREFLYDRPRPVLRFQATARFIEANKLEKLEAEFMRVVVGVQTDIGVALAKDILHQLIAEAGALGQQPVVVRTEENHHTEREES